MTIAEVKSYCMKHYNDGLDVVIECWEDEDIQEMIDRGNPMKELKDLASVVNEERAAAKYFSGEDYNDGNPFSTFDDYAIPDELYDYEYIPSATRSDYSPSNPWNAPGMSIHDFI